jgi:transposase-like protein
MSVSKKGEDMGRRKYNTDFKKKVALEAIREQKTINHIAKEYQLHPVQVSEWKKQLLDRCGVVFEGEFSRNSNEEEIAALERKVGRLCVENDFLKKKLGG